MTNGSHGCVNLPYAMAQEIYGYVEKNTPVICYYLPGTEPEPLPEIPVEPEPGLPQEGTQPVPGGGTAGKERPAVPGASSFAPKRFPSRSQRSSLGGVAIQQKDRCSRKVNGRIC